MSTLALSVCNIEWQTFRKINIQRDGQTPVGEI